MKAQLRNFQQGKKIGGRAISHLGSKQFNYCGCADWWKICEQKASALEWLRETLSIQHLV